MITKVELRNFKRFKHQVFDLNGNVVLAGPNNSGKSTLVQAIAVWNLAVRKWQQDKGEGSGSKASKRTGVQLARSEFNAIPLREMNLLWLDRSTAYRKDELGSDQKIGTPKPLEIILNGRHNGKDWSLGMQFTYRYPDLIWVRPTDDSAVSDIWEILDHHNILVIPSFSGIGITETRYDRPYQEMLLGQGKPGDLIRNKLLEVYELKDKSRWEQLVSDIQEIFGYTLLPPQYNGQPYIIAEYVPSKVEGRPKNSDIALDLSSAGSGFLQVVLLLSFIYSQSTALILLDEPDAHLHVVLQKQAYDRLRHIAAQNKSQLVVATHSEVVIDSTSPDSILSFFSSPHRLQADFESEQVQAALRTLTSMDLLFADRWPYILYLEGKSDFNLLREWAKVLEHPFYRFFKNEEHRNPFWHNNIGRDPKNAKQHLFALKAINPALKGVLLLDGDARNLKDHEIRQDGLEIIRWRRYEAENYLLHQQRLLRFIAGSEASFKSPGPQTQAKLDAAKSFLQDNILPANLNDPFLDNDFQESIAASKHILPGLFDACQMTISKSEYYLIAADMRPEEIHPEVVEKLDFLSDRFV